MRYTTEQIEYLRVGFLKMPAAQLTDAFNAQFEMDKTVSKIKAALKNHKIRCGRRGGVAKGSYRVFTREQAEFIANEYTRLSLVELTIAFNRHFGTNRPQSQFWTFIRTHRIQSGRTGYFEKGKDAWNQGTKGVAKPNSGSFKKGAINVPSRVTPIGFERFCKHQGIWEVKVDEPDPNTGAPTRYRAKHLVIWEQHHGPVPLGKLVAFKDGDRHNCTVENLELSTREEVIHLNRNGFSNLPDELKPTMRALAKLEVKCFKRANRRTEKPNELR